jgi:hypothetical protein
MKKHGSSTLNIRSTSVHFPSTTLSITSKKSEAFALLKPFTRAIEIKSDGWKLKAA